MEQVSDRELLRELAAKPIGNEALAEEANRVAYGEGRPSPELIETIKRTVKIWLPAGKRSAAIANRAAARLAAEAQVDLEDAVEQAGGERGHMGRAA